jgi:hypothetical protein
MSESSWTSARNQKAPMRKGASAMTIRALFFDAYGTLYDVQSVLATAEALCPGKGDAITQVWWLKQLEYTGCAA